MRAPVVNRRKSRWSQSQYTNHFTSNLNDRTIDQDIGNRHVSRAAGRKPVCNPHVSQSQMGRSDGNGHTPQGARDVSTVDHRVTRSDTC